MLITKHVMDAVCSVTGISESEILSPSRLWPIVEARLLFILSLSRHGYKDEAIANILGRTRPTIFKSRHTAESYLDISRVFSAKFYNISELYATSQIQIS